MAANPDEGPEIKEEKKVKKRKPLLLIILILIPVLLLGTAGAFYFLGSGIPFTNIQREEVAVDTPPKYTYTMNEFQVNLADPGTRRFLRTTLDLAYDERSLTKEIGDRESELRSLIISTLRSKYVEDLDEPGGMKDLEQELLERLNSALDSGELEAIYYNEFIFQ